MCAISSNICAIMLHTLSHARSHYTGRRGSTCLALRDMLASCVHHMLLQSLHLLLVLGRSVFQLTDALVQERHDLTIRRGLYGMSHPSAASLPTTHTHRVPPETAPTCAITRSLSSFALRTSASTSASRCTRKPLTRVAAASRWRMSSFSVFACVSCCSHCVQQPRYTTLHAQATTTTLVPHLLQRTTQSSDLTPRSMGT